MRTSTKTVVDEGIRLTKDGVPALRRSNGRLLMEAGMCRWIAFDELRDDGEVTMSLLGGDGSYEDRHMARVTRVGDAVRVETADGTIAVPFAGDDEVVRVFSPLALDLVVDDVVVGTLPLDDASMAAGTAIPELRRLVGEGRGTRGTYAVRRADRLPWRLRRSTLTRVATASARRDRPTRWDDPSAARGARDGRPRS